MDTTCPRFDFELRMKKYFRADRLVWWLRSARVSLIAAAVTAMTASLAGTPRTIYQTTGSDNIPVFTDRAISKNSRVIYKAVERRIRLQPCLDGALSTAKPVRDVPQEIRIAIRAAARTYALEEALLHAVVKTESAYNTKAISKAGAVGLMQLMPATAVRYGVTDRTDAFQSVDGGARYLKDLIELFNGDMSLALAGYNAGENAVLRHGSRIPPYPETRDYVAKVMEKVACGLED
jgi:hypothetical protein